MTDDEITAALDAGRYVSPQDAKAAQDRLMKHPAFWDAKNSFHSLCSREVRRLSYVVAGEPIPAEVQALARGDRDPPMQAARDYMADNAAAFASPKDPRFAEVSAEAARLTREAAGPEGGEAI